MSEVLVAAADCVSVRVFCEPLFQQHRVGHLAGDDATAAFGKDAAVQRIVEMFGRQMLAEQVDGPVV